MFALYATKGATLSLISNEIDYLMSIYVNLSLFLPISFSTKLRLLASLQDLTYLSACLLYTSDAADE